MLFSPKSVNKKVFNIVREEWTREDDDDMRMFTQTSYYTVLCKMLNKRIDQRTTDLVNGKETKDRIDEISDLLLELQNYANP